VDRPKRVWWRVTLGAPAARAIMGIAEVRGTIMPLKKAGKRRESVGGASFRRRQRVLPHQKDFSKSRRERKEEGPPRRSLRGTDG